MHDLRPAAGSGDPRFSTREFDYSEGDAVADAVLQSRREIAEQIRRVAAADPYSAPAVQAAYQRAAELAEGRGVGSADEQQAGRQPGQGWQF